MHKEERLLARVALPSLVARSVDSHPAELGDTHGSPDVPLTERHLGTLSPGSKKSSLIVGSSTRVRCLCHGPQLSTSVSVLFLICNLYPPHGEEVESR